jgi:diguanylate cyclase (GGDEF)-like protein
MAEAFRDGQESLVTAALMAAGDAVYRWDLVADTMTWAGSLGREFGVPPQVLFASGESFHGRINPEDLAGRLRALSDHYVTRQPFDCEYRMRRPDGEFSWVHDRGAAEFAPTGEPVALTGTLRVIDRRKQHEARLEHLATFDELTGHFNRTRLRQALQQIIVHSQRYGLPGAYLSVGIDKLALVNDAYGYVTADAVIVAAGQRLERVLRASDVMGRIGGDVFGIVLSHCPETETATVADKILRAFREHPIQTPSGPIHITVTIGGVAFPGQVQTAVDAITRAEAAMHEAKRLGRDGFRAYRMSEEQRRDHRRSIAVCEQVTEALKTDRLLFAFQPVVACASHEVQFHECLIRMHDPAGNVVQAAAFVPTVERLGLVRLLDRRALDLAVQELARHEHACLALNISGLTATEHSWLRALMALVGSRRDLARRLIVEITETAAIQDIEETSRFVATVRGLGCRVALDDFGAGYTSFRHLKALTVDIVKIDGSFVAGIAENDDNRLFVRTLVGLARNFGLQTVAERVETAAEAAVLAELGVDSLQGYHFGKPALTAPWHGNGRAVREPAAAGTLEGVPTDARAGDRGRDGAPPRPPIAAALSAGRT